MEPDPPVDFGKYRLASRLAVGGMAQIWLAAQRGPHGFEKTAVLKVILPEVSNNDEFVKMFLDEARLAAGIDHDNVVRIYDFGQLNGQYYLAMEYLPGEDLSSILQELRRTPATLPIELACEIIIKASAGLQVAHELTDGQGRPLNLVHRDISPSNIIITYHGGVKLVDFGIARAEGNLSKTGAGVLKGKLAYLSPEQAAGEAVDRRSDVFALGTVLYELLTLHRPFRRDSEWATVNAVIKGDIDPPSRRRADVPAELDAVVMRAMSRDLNDRWPSAAAMADALEAVLQARGHASSDKRLAEMMADLFGRERRDRKLRAMQANLAGMAAAPSATRSEPVAAPAGQNQLPAALTVTGLEALSAARRPKRRALWIIGLALTAAVSWWLGTRLGPSRGNLRPTAQSSESQPPTARPVEPERAKPDSSPPAKPTEPAPVRPADPLSGTDSSVPEPVSAEVPPPRGSQSAESAVAPPRAGRAVAPRGRLTLDTSPWSEVYLKGRKLGDTPIVELPLPAGIHALTLVNSARGLRQVIEVQIQSGKTTEKRLKL